MQSRLIALITSILLTLIQGCNGVSEEKETFAENMKEDFLSGDFRVFQKTGIFLEKYDQPLKHKDIYNSKGEIVGRDFAEEWMKDPAEGLNRTQMRLIKGDFNQDAKVVFNEFAQRGSWWVSNDLKKIFITTDWEDYHKQGIVPSNLYLGNARIYKIFRSLNSGGSFQEIKWNKKNPIIQILLDNDGKNGYIIGGNRELWRTMDSGENWSKIGIPNSWQLLQQNNEIENASTTFDAYFFDSLNKNLYLSVFIFRNNSAVNEIYRIPLGKELTDINKIKPILKINDLYIHNINVEGDSIYFLGEKFNFNDFSTQVNHKSAQFVRYKKDGSLKVVNLGDRLSLGYLGISQNGTLFIIGSKVSESGLNYSDIYMTSTDNGGEWKLHESDGNSQGIAVSIESNKLIELKANKLFITPIE